MASCSFCGRDFVNAQAVRAHLKSCEPYLDRRAARQEQADSPREPRLRQTGLKDGSLGSPSLRQSSLTQSGPIASLPEERPGATADGFDPVRQLDQEIAMSQRRLKLRELRDVEDDLDRRMKAKDRDSQREVEAIGAAEREKLAARERENETRRLEEDRIRENEQRARRRRESIQDAKRQAIDRWTYATFLSSNLRARMLIEIDRTLFALPAEELPVDELTRIAEGVRDRLYGEAKAAERESSRREQERTARKTRLRQEGMDYAKRELNDVDGLDSLTRWSIEQRIARALDDITGDESSDDIEGMVEDILEREGIGFDDNGNEDDE